MPVIPLPSQLEICARPRDGRACGGVIYRPDNGKSSCWSCGSDQPGVVYLKTAILPDLRGLPQRAADTWKANCGPAAIAAVCGLTLDEVRPHLGDFEKKGYTNPTLMFDTLRRLGRTWVPIVRRRTDAQHNGTPPTPIIWLNLGLVRVQWEGPWTRPGVPMVARYRHTHWVGARSQGAPVDPASAAIFDSAMKLGIEIFDVNCLCVGGWVTFAEWSGQVVPWLLKEAEPKANGQWHQTHVLELAP